MRNFTLYFLITSFLSFLIACAANTETGSKVYYYTISKQNSKEVKDSIYAPSDIAAVDSTVRRYYQLMSEYNAERKKLSNNVYVTKPLEWRLMNRNGEYVTSVSSDDVDKIVGKYKTPD